MSMIKNTTPVTASLARSVAALEASVSALEGSSARSAHTASTTAKPPLQVVRKPPPPATPSLAHAEALLRQGAQGTDAKYAARCRRALAAGGFDIPEPTLPVPPKAAVDHVAGRQTFSLARSVADVARDRLRESSGRQLAIAELEKRVQTTSANRATYAHRFETATLEFQRLSALAQANDAHVSKIERTFGHRPDDANLLRKAREDASASRQALDAKGDELRDIAASLDACKRAAADAERELSRARAVP